MKSPSDCAHEACGCRAERASQFCSAECGASAAKASRGCDCGHEGCHAKESSKHSLGGNQGEGNREADRRYREGATEFAASGRVGEKAREAADDVEARERGGRKQSDR